MLNLIRENRATLCIKIDKEGEMLIKAPKKMPLSDILVYVNKHESWINKKQTSIKEILKINEPIINYEKFLYLGNCYNGVISNKLKEIEIEGINFIVPEKFARNVPYYVAKWLKTQALSIIENRVLYLASIYKIEFYSLKIYNSKTGWGSCNSQRDLHFNWRIIMLPPNVIDYVIIHELAHLFEMNHSIKFWKVVDKMMPNYKKEKEVLKNCNYVLNLFR